MCIILTSYFIEFKEFKEAKELTFLNKPEKLKKLEKLKPYAFFDMSVAPNGGNGSNFFHASLTLL